MSRLAPLVLLLAACKRHPVDEPLPWDDLAPVAPSAWAPVLESAFDEAQASERLVAVPDLPSVASLDAGLGRVHLMDGRYRHIVSGWCVPLYGWALPDDGIDRQEACADGEVWVRRGEIAGLADIRAVAADPARSRLLALDAGGRWTVASTDLDAGNPVDWLRGLGAGEAAGFEDADAPGLLAVSTGGAVIAAVGASVWSWTALDAESVGSTAPGEVRDVVFAGETPWLATAAGLVRGGDLVDPRPVDRLLPSGDGVWATLAAEGVLVRFDGAGEAAEEVAIDGLTGPLAADGLGRLWVAVEGGMARVEGGQERARFTTDPVLDVVAQPSGELVLLHTGGRVAVFFDETTLGGRAPLNVSIATFFENPKKRGQGIPCEETDPNFRAYLDSAQRNRAWLDDVPAALLFAATPMVARQAWDCEVSDELVALFDNPRTALGVLFHDDPPCDPGDQGCVNGYLGGEVSAFSDLDLHPTWSSGASAWDLDGTDWVEGVLASGVPPEHLFFGMAALPEITQEDPRQKEPLPWRGAEAPTGWSLDAPNGTLAMFPGNPISAFLLSDCPNLLSEECGRVDAGGGARFSAEDVQVLDLQLRRALYGRSAAGPDTWYFHLPALELFDYTTGCTETADVWSGEDCAAGLVQAWAYDVHARFVLNDLVAWTLPAEL